MKPWDDSETHLREHAEFERQLAHQAIAEVHFIGGPWDGTKIEGAKADQWKPMVYVRIFTEPLHTDKIPKFGRPTAVDPRINGDVSEFPPGHRYVRRWHDPRFVVYSWAPAAKGEVA